MLSTLLFAFITIITKSIIWSIAKYFQWHNNSNSKHCWNSITAKKMSIICKTLAVIHSLQAKPQDIFNQFLNSTSELRSRG